MKKHLPPNIDKYKVSVDMIKRLNNPRLLFRDIESVTGKCDGKNGILTEDDYLAEGIVKPEIFFDNTRTGNNLQVKWVSPLGSKPIEKTWRSFDEVELFLVPIDIYNNVRLEITKLEIKNESIYEKALSIINKRGFFFEFKYNEKSKNFISNNPPATIQI